MIWQLYESRGSDLHDQLSCVQASGDKPSAAAILTSYMAYAFVDYQTASVALLQACQALAVAAGRITHGQAFLASCLLHDSSGEPTHKRQQYRSLT